MSNAAAKLVTVSLEVPEEGEPFFSIGTLDLVDLAVELNAPAVLTNALHAGALTWISGR